MRERRNQHLRPGLNKGPFTMREEALVMRLQHIHGNKWSAIAQAMADAGYHRADNSIKNRWHAHIRKHTDTYRRLLQTADRAGWILTADHDPDAPRSAPSSGGADPGTRRRTVSNAEGGGPSMALDAPMYEDDSDGEHGGGAADSRNKGQQPQSAVAGGQEPGVDGVVARPKTASPPAAGECDGEPEEEEDEEVEEGRPRKRPALGTLSSRALAEAAAVAAAAQSLAVSSGARAQPPAHEGSQKDTSILLPPPLFSRPSSTSPSAAALAGELSQAQLNQGDYQQQQAAPSAVSDAAPAALSRSSSGGGGGNIFTSTLRRLQTTFGGGSSSVPAVPVVGAVGAAVPASGSAFSR